MRNAERRRFLRDLPRGAHIFEIGAGDGSLVAALVASGYDAAGAEPYRHPRAARERIDRKTVDDVELPPHSQDAVVLWHVLEHLDDPAETLRRAHEWLREGGRLLVAVPNLRSLQARIGGDRWFQLDLPRHTTHFTPAGLARLLERTGFRSCRTSQLVVEQNVVAMWQTLLNRLTSTPNTAYTLVKGRPAGDLARDALLTAFAGPLLVPVATVLELGATVAGRGGSIVARARA